MKENKHKHMLELRLRKGSRGRNPRKIQVGNKGPMESIYSGITNKEKCLTRSGDPMRPMLVLNIGQLVIKERIVLMV